MRVETLQTVRAAAAAAIAGVLVSLLAIAGGAWLGGPVVFEMTEALPRLVASGFYPPERAGDLTFSWTSERADLKLAGLDRSRPWQCVVRLRAARGAPLELPRVDLLVDGLIVASRSTSNDFEGVAADLPPMPGRTGAQLGIATTPTFVPGPGDRRTLGVQVDRITCAPTTTTIVPPADGELTRGAIAAGGFGAAAGLAGVPAIAAMGLASLAAIAQAVPLAYGPAAYTGFAAILLRLALFVALTFGIAIRIGELVRRAPIGTVTRAAVMLAGVLLYAQLLGLFHPSKPLIDAVFHAHRFDAVLAGHYFFTQPMPAGVSFPYAIGLYVFAAPWARLTADHVALLRIVVCAADAAAYLLLFRAIARNWDDRLSATLALALCFVLPIAFEVIGNANLTNEFGHAASVATVALASMWPARRWRTPHAIAMTILCTLGFLSHVSTIALLACTLVALGGLYWWRGAGGKPRGATLLLVTLVAGVLSVALYYGHFGDVYIKALRVRSQAAEAPPAAAPPGLSPGAIRAAIPLTLAQRVQEAARLTVSSFGWPMLVLAAAGAVAVMRRPRGDPMALLAGACAMAFLLFVGAGTMRVNPAFQRYAAEFITRVALAVSPGVIVLAGAGTAWGLRSGWLGRAAASAMFVWAVGLGVQHWIAWFA